MDDAATRVLMVDLHRRRAAGADPGVALSRAQRAFVEAARRERTEHFHPFFWAPFVHFGVR